MMNKRKILLNRRDCWVRSTFGMRRNKDSVDYLNVNERSNQNPENTTTLSELTLVGKRRDLDISKKT
jgi:hypothetical protein